MGFGSDLARITQLPGTPSRSSQAQYRKPGTACSVHTGLRSEVSGTKELRVFGTTVTVIPSLPVSKYWANMVLRVSTMGRFLIKLWRAEQGQDMIEYALLAAALVLIVAGFLPTTLMPSVSVIFSKIVATFAKA